MNRCLRTLLVATLVAGTTAMALAKMMPNIVEKPTRFSGACCVYTGAPALPVTLSMIIAGGGPDKFSTIALVKTLAGDKTDAEVASLKAKFADEKVGNFLKVFEYVVTDSLYIVNDDKVALPKTPNPDPKDGKALATALWGAGQTGNGFNVEVMLDRAVSHPIHDQVMTAIDKKFGIAADADYHAVLDQAMRDLASVYGLK
jgi:hypothetical protein